MKALFILLLLHSVSYAQDIINEPKWIRSGKLYNGIISVVKTTPDKEYIVVGGYEDAEVRFLDSRTGLLYWNIRADGKRFGSDFAGVRDIALHPDGYVAIVFNGFTDRVEVWNYLTKTLAYRRDFDGVDRMPVKGVAFPTDANELLISVLTHNSAIILQANIETDNIDTLYSRALSGSSNLGIQKMLFSPNRQFLAINGEDHFNDIIILNYPSGSVHKTIQSKYENFSFGFTPDGEKIYVPEGGQKKVRYYLVSDGQFNDEHTLDFPSGGNITDFEYFNNGKNIAIAQVSSTIIVDASSFSLVKTLPVSAKSFAISNDEKTFFVDDWYDGSYYYNIESDDSWYYDALIFAYDLNFNNTEEFVFASGAGDNMQRWEVGNGKWSGAYKNAGGRVCTYLPASDQILSHSGETINIIRFTDGSVVNTYYDTTSSPRHYTRSLISTSDGTRIISTTEDSILTIWEGQSPYPMYQSKVGPDKEFISTIQFSPDNQYVVMLCNKGGSDQLQIYNAADMSVFKKFPAPVSSDGKDDICFFPDSKRFFFSTGNVGWDGIFDFTADGLFRDTIEFAFDSAYGIMDAEISKDGKYLVASCYDSLVHVFDMSQQKLIQIYTGYKDQINKVAISPSNKFIAAAMNDGAIVVWETKGLMSSVKEEHAVRVTGIPCIETGSYSILGSNLSFTFKNSCDSPVPVTMGLFDILGRSLIQRKDMVLPPGEMSFVLDINNVDGNKLLLLKLQDRSGRASIVKLIK
jgi:WD40 repeat protein